MAERFGLGQYEALFREHEIDADVLRELVEADLEKIGVPLGHRKRLLPAIVALSLATCRRQPRSPRSPHLPRPSQDRARTSPSAGRSR